MSVLIKGYRPKKERVRTAKGRDRSSSEWLRRHINDPYVHLAKKHNYLSRAAFKLIEIDDKYKLITKAASIIDIGAAPGGWLQVIESRKKNGIKVIGVDLLDINLSFSDLILIKGNFLEESVHLNIKEVFGSNIDLILSDMATSSTGDRELDHLRNSELVDSVIEFSKEMLKKDGNLIFKYIRGSEEAKIIRFCRSIFSKVKVFKPESSYKNSAEIYVICLSKL